MAQLMLTTPENLVDTENMVWWAEGGLLHGRDNRTGEVTSLTVRQMLPRIKALNDMLKNRRNSSGELVVPGSTFTKIQNLVAGFVKLCQNAQAQGRPEDPRTRAQRHDEIRKRQRRRVVLGGK